MYKVIAPVLRSVWKNKVAAKPLAGTKTILHYPKGQHLGFLKSSVIRYEPGLRDRISKFINDADLVFEIGSNIGQYTLWLSEKVGSSGEVIAVEPDNDNLVWLRKNIDFNACQNVTILPMAVSDKEGTLTFYHDNLTGGRSSSLIQTSKKDTPLMNEQLVQTTTIQKLYQDYGIPAFVKVDVEGAESLIFHNQECVRKESVYFVEFRDTTSAHITQLFIDAGFDLYIIDHGMDHWTPGKALPSFGNFLCIHKSRGPQ